MYVPTQFREERRDVLIAAMRDIQLAALVTAGAEGMHATHIPMVVREIGDDLVVETHVARGNEHWRHQGMQSLAIFQGPHAYVHPGWYESKQEHGKVVPTWTYVVVHAHGVLETFQDQAELIEHVTRLTEQNEASRDLPWAVSDAPEKYITSMTRGIVGLRFKVTQLEGSWKLNQHKSDTDRSGVIAGLSASGAQDARSVAELMRAGNQRHATEI
ncbi:FMN-binding negative transcriptional regulator [Mesorhizobium sp. CAU 1741]|uniref:FMN-binding negative transcriptional regulator n=1 Tax=Mesorhizobium sp. CAU 1741 TaxID=3140366 RepID=UPI00325A9AFB